MIGARPQRNGNTKDDFAAAYKALTDARRAVDEAAKALRMNVLHGRNYQHLDHRQAHETHTEDLRRMGYLRVALVEMERFQDDIIEQINS